MSDPSDRPDTRSFAGLDRELVAFFALAFALAWGVYGILGVIGWASGGVTATELLTRGELLDFEGVDLVVPGLLVFALTRVADFSFSIAGVVLIWMTAGRPGLRTLASRLTRVRIGWQWYLVALLPVVLYTAAAVFAGVTDDAVALTVDASPAAIRAVLFAIDGGLLVTLFLRGALGEELGLRGFALPRLQERTNPFHASLVIGVLWGLWHLPVLVGREPLIVVVFLLLAIGLSFVFTWLFNGSGGSLVPVLLFHTFQNSEEMFETLLPALVGTDWELLSTLSLLVVGIAVGVWLFRQRRRARTVS